MIYVTGDIHGACDIGKLSNKSLKLRDLEIGEDDYLIILGDFGLPFFDPDEKEDKEYLYWIKWLSEKPWTTLWIDGNHDSFNYWSRQEITEMFGGKVQVHPKADNVIHLMRGEIYTIEGKTFFAFGGATSTDKDRRTVNVSWWPAEEPQLPDIENAEKHLFERNYTVDYVLTHTPPADIIQKMGHSNFGMAAQYLRVLRNKLKYHRWFCGHMHEDSFFEDEKIVNLYTEIIKIDAL